MCNMHAAMKRNEDGGKQGEADCEHKMKYVFHNSFLNWRKLLFIGWVARIALSLQEDARVCSLSGAAASNSIELS